MTPQVIEARLPRLVGYAGVSTDEQTTALQLDALRAAGCAVIHEDSASGALRSRPGLDLALADVWAGDTLVVWRLDRLSRSLWALLDVAQTLRERGAILESRIASRSHPGRMDSELDPCAQCRWDGRRYVFLRRAVCT